MTEDTATEADAEDAVSAHDAEVFIDQARWLLEAHTARSDGLISRAVGLLGFIGVVLALLLQGSALKGIDPSLWTWSFLIVAVGLMLLSAYFALRTISPKTTAMPGVDNLNDWWQAHRGAPEPGSAAPQIAESLLGPDKTGTSVVSAARKHADVCAKEFGRSIRSTLFAFTFLSLLILNVLLNARG